MELQGEIKPGNYVVLKQNPENNYSKKIVREFGIIPEETIGLVDRVDKFTNSDLASVYWRLPLNVSPSDLKRTEAPKDPIEIPPYEARPVALDEYLKGTTFMDVPSGGKKARKSRKSRKSRKVRKSYKKYRKSRKARKSRRRARR